VLVSKLHLPTLRALAYAKAARPARLEALTVDVDDGAHYFVIVKAVSEKSVFGAPVTEIECVEDNGRMIPAVLVVMKRYLYDQQALDLEGVFRLQGNEEEMNVVKDQLNRGVFVSCKDIHVVACLVKQWFRDMPQSILADIPTQTLLNLSTDPTEYQLREIVQYLREPNLSLFVWLTDLLTEVASREAVNKMSPRNLAIVVAPNLFAMNDQNQVDAVMLSQKVVVFVAKVLHAKLQAIRER